MDKVPVILVTYNRPDHTVRVLESLKGHNVQNLYVFCDAPKHPKDAPAVEQVRALIRSIDWCTPTVIERTENFGLARSIVSAVDMVFEQHDRLILLEDDCVPGPHFFDFMDDCLSKYEHNERVFGISGYTVQMPDEFVREYPHDVYFCPRIGSWGWATWKRAWRHYDRDLWHVVSQAVQSGVDLAQGGDDFPTYLTSYFQGKLKDVWTLNWVVSVYLHGGVYVYPTTSHIDNIGHDSTGVHCSTTKGYVTTFCDRKPTAYPEEATLDSRIMESFRKYYSTSGSNRDNAIRTLRRLVAARSAAADTLSVGYIGTHDTRGGAANVSWALKEGLADRGHHTQMFVGAKFTNDPDVHVITDAIQDGEDTSKQTGLLAYHVKSTFNLPANPELQRANILHLHNLHANYFNILALPALTAFRPCVWTLHDMNSMTGHCGYAYDCDKWQSGCGPCGNLKEPPAITVDATGRMWQDKKEVYRQSDLELVVPSQWLKAIVEKSILRDKKCHLIYNGIDTGVFKPGDRAESRRQFKVPESAIVIGFGADGGLRNLRKGTQFVLDAYNYFVARYPNVVFMNIGGTSGTRMPRLFEIPYIDDQAQLARFYSMCDVFIFPTLADNCPLGVLELMACGVPVVSFKTGGVPELIENGRSGLLADYCNKEQFIQAIESLVNNKARRIEFGSNGHERANRLFSLDVMLDRYIDVYRQVIDGWKQRHPDQATIHAGTSMSTGVAPVIGKNDEVCSKYLVSAIVSTYNSEAHIRGCLESLESQTIADKLEIIVIDSGSQQNEAAIVKEFQQRYDNIKYIRTERETIYGAWNRAIKAASGKYIANANTDDRYYEDALEKLATALENNPNRVVAYGNQHVVSTIGGEITGELRAQQYSHSQLISGVCIHSQPMWRRDIHDVIGYFDEQFFVSGDYEFWIRATSRFDVLYLDHFTGMRLINESVVSRSQKSLLRLENQIISQGYEYAARTGERMGLSGISGDVRFAEWPEVKVWKRQVTARLSSRLWQPTDEVVAVKDMRSASSAKLSVIAIETAPADWRCIQSLVKQGHQDLELILIVYRNLPCPSDLEVFAGRCCVVQLKGDIGVAFARNVGMAHAKGEFVAYLDSGMRADDGWVEAVLRRFTNPQVKAVRGQTIDAGSHMQPCETESYATFCENVDNCAFRKASLTEAGGFNEDLFALEGYELSYRIYKGASNALDAIRFEPGMLVRCGNGLTESQLICRDIRKTRMSRLIWGKYNDIEGFLEFYRIQNPATRSQYDGDYDKIVATAVFLEKDHPTLALDYARKAVAIEPDEQVKGSYLYGSLLLKYEKHEQARDVLESAMFKLAPMLAVDPGQNASERQLESQANDMKCYVSTCTKLAQCYMKSGEYRKVKTIYQSLLENSALPVEPQQRAGFETVLAKLISIQAVPIKQESPGRVQARQEPIQSSRIAALSAGPNEPAKSEYLVSAIVSTYNSENLIRGCIEDLERQTIADKLEIIVIDSGSQQNEEAIVRELQNTYDNIRYVKTEHEGLYAAWNRAIKLATGKYLTSANTDDRHRADCFERLAAALEADPQAGMAYADQVKSYIENETFENTSATLTYTYPEFHPDVFLEIGHHHAGSQPMWRADLHDAIGLFDERFRVAGDYDFLLRICERFRCIHLPEVLGTFHHSPNTISGSRLELLNRIENPIARAGSFYRKAVKAIQQNDRGLAIDLLQKSINDWPTREALLKMNSCRQNVQQAPDSLAISRIRSIDDWPDTEAFLKTGAATDTLATLVAQKGHAYRHLYNSPDEPALSAVVERQNNLLRLMQDGNTNVVERVCDRRVAGHQAQVSVIIAATDAPAELDHAIAALAGQNCPAFEVIVVGAGLPIEELARRYSPALNLCYVELSADYGSALARNVGVAHAACGIVAFLDKEMQPQTDYVRNLLAHFEDASVAGLRGRVLSQDGTHACGDRDCGEQVCFAMADIEGLCAFRKSAFVEVGGFDQRLCLHHGPELSYRVFIRCGSDPACFRYFPDVVTFADPCPTGAQALEAAIDNPLYTALADHINPRLAEYRQFIIGSYPQNQGRYHVGFRQLLGRAAFLENWDLPQALNLARKAVLQQPDSFRAKYVLGSICAKLGDFKNASEHLEQVIDPLMQVIANTAKAAAPEELADHHANNECLASTAAKLAQCYLKLGTVNKFMKVCRLIAESASVPESTRKRLNSLLEKLRSIPPEQVADAQTSVPSSGSASALPAAPVVSVVMPVYNCRQYIAQGIGSVLTQSYSDIELVVIDDGSTDGSADVIRSLTDPRIRYIRKANGGASKARNEGIRHATGRYVVLLDADDVITPDYILEHMQAFQANPAAALVYCDHILIDEQGAALRELRQFEYTDRVSLVRDMFRCGYPVIQPRGMLRRDIFDTIGLLDETLLVGEDYELMSRFIRAGMVAVHLPKSLYKRRMRSGSLTHNDDPARANSHFAAVDSLIRRFSHSELFPDVNWSAVPSDKIAATAKCLVGTTFLAMARNYRMANKSCSATQALIRAASNLRESAVLDRTNTKSRQLVRDCEILRRQILLSATDEASPETGQDSASCNDNNDKSLNNFSGIMGT